MPKRLIVLLGVSLVVLTFSSDIRGQNQAVEQLGSGAEPKRDAIGTGCRRRLAAT